jgi:hypothetical protein
MSVPIVYSIGAFLLAFLATIKEVWHEQQNLKLYRMI